MYLLSIDPQTCWNIAFTIGIIGLGLYSYFSKKSQNDQHGRVEKLLKEFTDTLKGKTTEQILALFEQSKKNAEEIASMHAQAKQLIEELKSDNVVQMIKDVLKKIEQLTYALQDIRSNRNNIAEMNRELSEQIAELDNLDWRVRRNINEDDDQGDRINKLERDVATLEEKLKNW